MVRATKVDKKRLVETLTGNRSKHVEQYLEAFAGYKKELLVKLAALVARAETLEPSDIKAAGNYGYIEFHSVNLEVPQDHRLDYDRALNRMEWELGDEILVSENDFNCFVRDEWNWRDQFVGSHRRYTG